MKSLKLTFLLPFLLICVFINTSSAQWVQMANGIGNNTPSALAISGNNIFAGTGFGVYLTTNNGTNWIQTSLNNRYIWSLAVNGNDIFAGTYAHGVYISSNNGTSWTQTSLNFPTVRALAIYGNNVFAGT